MNVTSQAIGSRQASVGMTPPTDDVMALGGVAASAHPFVTATALDVIRQGGNAVDAAVAAAAVLTVVEPRNGHLGGDTFMLINLPGENRVVALNGSGAAPAAASLEQYVARGGIPKDGLWAASVPGTVHCWGTAVERYGSMPLAGLLAPAIGYARAGVPVSRRLRRMLANEAERFRRFPASARIFVPDGRVPEVGEVFRQPELARSLERIARDGWQDFYSGALARELVQASDELDGLFSLDDFATHDTLERAPLSSDYRGYTVFEQPPVSQGIIVLLALNILRQFDLPSLGPATAATIHLQIEALKLAFEDALCHLGDPDHVELPLEALLSDEHARKQAARIRPEAAMPFPWPGNIQPDTTYMCAADGQGTVVSYIHSLFAGCAVVLGDTGALMNNRMLGFNLTPGHPNCLAPGKRPVHTLNNYLVQRDGEPVLVGGTPGAHWQVQTNIQILTNSLDFGMEPHEAIAAPRFLIGDQIAVGDPNIRLESRVGPEVIDALREKGHQIEEVGPWALGGGVQLIARDPASHIYRAATDLRRPGNAVGGI